MLELHQVGEHTYYADCYARVGFYDSGEGAVYMIDSGTDEKEAQELFAILEKKHWRLQGILLTHGHGDHAGGCKYLQERLHIPVYATREETCFSRNRMLSPTYMTGGFPPREMFIPLLMPEEFECQELTEDVLPEGLEMIELPGHNFHMVGFKTRDDVVFLADSIYSRKMLHRYHINFMYDVGAFYDTLHKIKKMKASLYVPSHIEPLTEIEALADENIKKIDEITQYIVDFCEHPISYDELIGKLFDVYGRKLDMQQYYLVGFTVHSFLSWLKEKGNMQIVYEDNMLCWRSWHAG